MDETLTPAQKRLKILLKIWMIVFPIAGLYFAICSNLLFEQANFISTLLGLNLPLVPLPQDKFWLALTVAMMFNITVLCYFAQKDLLKWGYPLVPILLVCKGVSTLMFLIWYFIDHQYFLYLLGSVFCDGPIFVITLIFYYQARLCPRCRQVT